MPARGTRGPASVRAVSLRATEEFGDERKTEAMGVSHRSFSDCLVLLGTVVPLLPDPVCVIAPRSSAPRVPVGAALAGSSSHVAPLSPRCCGGSESSACPQARFWPNESRLARIVAGIVTLEF